MIQSIPISGLKESTKYQLPKASNSEPSNTQKISGRRRRKKKKGLKRKKSERQNLKILLSDIDNHIDNTYYITDGTDDDTPDDKTAATARRSRS